MFDRTASVIQFLNAHIPFVPRFWLLHWSRSAHLFDQCATNASLASNSSTSRSRLIGLGDWSSRKIFTRLGSGGMPVRSSDARRTNSASVQSSDGRIFIFFSFA